jgi:uncharacterized protein with HEPN domain
MVQDAMVRNFEIIGEAAGSRSPTLRENGVVPWATPANLSAACPVA